MPEKADKKLYTIGKLAKASGLNISTIRYYKDQGLISPADRTQSNYMLFDELSLARILRIKQLRSQRLTIDEIKKEIETTEGL